MSNFYSLVIDWFKEVVDTILSLPETIINLLGNCLKALFIPEDGYFDEKIQQMRDKFNFIDSIVETVHVFTNFFSNNSFGEPPTITVNLSSSQGVDYGMNAKAISFDWYKPFKPTVDLLLSSILWVVFAWNTFKDLPNIIGGVGSGATSTAKLGEYVEGGDNK